MVEMQTSRQSDHVDTADMVCQGGTVTRIEGDKAYVLIDRDKGCDACASKGHCGALFANTQELEVKTNIPLKPGQRVEIGVRPSAIFGASVLLFVVPAVAFLLGIILGYWLADEYGWWSQQWTGFIGGIILFIVSYLIIRLVTPRMQDSGRYEPVITRNLDD
jgi:sigma-E factor negative regulatory protein RseC